VLLFSILPGTVTALLAVLPHLLSGMAQPPVLSLSATLLLILALGLSAGAVNSFPPAKVRDPSTLASSR